MYGIDWDGPVPLNDEGTVTVAELPYYLTDEERETLSHVTTHPELTQETMIESFTIAKIYIASVTNQ